MNTFNNEPAEFLIREHLVRIVPNSSALQNELLGYQFSIFVDGIEIEAILCVRPDAVADGFVVYTTGNLKELYIPQYAKGKDSVESINRVLSMNWFNEYLLARKNEEGARERLLVAIEEEAAKFRDLLLRKFKQLTYVDEYETLEVGRFIEELKVFARKRLPETPIDFVVNEVYVHVSKWVHEEPSLDSMDYDSSMSPTEYERFCSERFAASGWNTKLTKASGDQGADIICEAKGIRLVVQCKKYSSSVGNAAVQEVIAAREYEYADRAVVVSNSSFTKSAKELASTAGVLLIHHDEISAIEPGR